MMRPGGPSYEKGSCLSRRATFTLHWKNPLRFAALSLVLFLNACAERDMTVSPSPQENARTFSSQTSGGEGMNLPRISAESGHSYDPPPGLPPHVPGVIVVLVNAEGDLEQLNQDYGTTTEEFYDDCNFGILLIPEGSDLYQICHAMEESGDCSIAEPIYLTESPESNQGTIPFYEGDHVISDVFDQDALSRMGAAQAHDDATGEGVVVAVLDTGVDYTHPDLSAFVSDEGYDFFDEDADPLDVVDGLDQDFDGSADEGAGHGTHVAGLVHAVAPGATILPIRVLDSEGNGTSVAVARGIRYAVENGAQVINLSLGLSTTADVIKREIQNARSSEIVVVASAGNRGILDPEHFPANRHEVLGVASTNSLDLKAEFSSYSQHVDMCAPGENILSTFLNHGYAIWSGTSMSTPMVSGAAALRIQLHPSADADEIIDAIEDSSLELDFHGYPYDGKMGEGRLDLAALTAAD